MDEYQNENASLSVRPSILLTKYNINFRNATEQGFSFLLCHTARHNQCQILAPLALLRRISVSQEQIENEYGRYGLK